MLKSIYSRQKFQNLLNKLKNKRILLITGRNSFKKSGAEYFFSKILEKKKLIPYFKKSKIPEISEVNKIIKIIKNKNPEIIIALGGGVVLDLAKISNNLHQVTNLKKAIIKPTNNISKNFCKLFAIPTTAGSGAEATSNAVIYINKKKYSVENKFIKPDIQILFPKLVEKNSYNLKLSSGFDAVAQAVESLLSLKSNNKSVKYSIISLEYSLKNYLSYLIRPNSLNSKNMILAANYSGQAINITKTTAPHAVSYPFTAHFGISHGHAVALTFSEFLEFNFQNMNKAVSSFPLPDRLEILLKLTGTQNLKELIKYFQHLKQKAGIVEDFRKLRINLNQNLDKIIKDINLQRLSNNPVKIDFQTIKEILLKKNS
jgi:alcohol dehydrogenase class IV|tara:strand:- start:383 stop:1498 length:1116 start_codon:yes stop_codon:yes gene_type:complete